MKEPRMLKPLVRLPDPEPTAEELRNERWFAFAGPLLLVLLVALPFMWGYSILGVVRAIGDLLFR